MSTSPESPVWSNHFGAASGSNSDTGVPEGASATDLRHDIARTRSEMSGTIDAIESRLTPQRLIAQAKDSLASSASAVATQAQVRANELATGAQEQTQRLRTEFERLQATYPWLPTALLAAAGAGATTLIAVLVWMGVRARD